ncbi:zinc ribbon domain-containing protein [Rheinheimera sp.]|uniref:zinc ribbon domain-containing protein n=1 Tax=Rheinheimera sp. TaxID=1869214 RepID=UPI0025F55725|nr:zinc ribbon domain-containing protein [Rheinheimera sp.]
MAIIACPYCDKKVSDKAASCNHCGNNLSEISVETLKRMQRDNRLAKGQQLNNHAMLALVLFLGSFTWFYYQSPEPDSWQQKALYAAMVVGCVWYLVTKVRIVMYKRK